MKSGTVLILAMVGFIAYSIYTVQKANVDLVKRLWSKR